MKKYLLFILILLICGCESKEITKTIIEENENYVISINYPKAYIKEVDNKIEEYVDSYYSNFDKTKGDEIKELNISYTYDYIMNRYVSIVIDVYKYDEFLESDTLVINYDTLENCFTDNIPVHEVKVNKEIKLNSRVKMIDPNSKVIALTFDDGPSYYTKYILETLNEYGVNATFFVIGNKVKLYKDVLKDVILSGNEIGNHTYSHKLLSRLSDDDYLDQINKTQALLKEYVGYTPVLFRPSYGSISKKFKSLTDLDIVLWNIDTLDWKYKSAKTIAKRAVSKARDMGIILMHDTHKRSNVALKIIIEELLSEGYEFVTISELEKIRVLRNLK